MILPVLAQKSFATLPTKKTKRRSERTESQTKFVVILSIHLIIYFTFLPLHTVSFLLRPHWFIYLDAHVCRSPVVKTTTKDRWCGLMRNRPKSMYINSLTAVDRPWKWNVSRRRCSRISTHVNVMLLSEYVCTEMPDAQTQNMFQQIIIYIYLFTFFFTDFQCGSSGGGGGRRRRDHL